MLRGGLLAGMALAGLVGRAEAGDLPVKTPPAAAAYDWTGYYVGGHVGYAAGTSGLVGDFDRRDRAATRRRGQFFQQL